MWQLIFKFNNALTIKDKTRKFMTETTTDRMVPRLIVMFVPNAKRKLNAKRRQIINLYQKSRENFIYVQQQKKG